MTINKKVTGKAASLPLGLAVGALVSILTTILICAVSAHLISTEAIAEEQIGYCSIAALICSTILGAVTAVRKIKHKRLVVCILSGAVYYLILLSVTALFFGGQYQGMGVTLIVILLGSLAALLITGREGKGRTPSKRKKIYR